MCVGLVVFCYLILVNFIFCDNARHISVCFFGIQTFKAPTQETRSMVVLRTTCQLKRNVSVSVSEAASALLSIGMIHLECCRIASASSRLWLFRCAQASGTSEGLISTYRTCAANELVSRSLELSATHIVWELHSSTHFPLWAATYEKEEGNAVKPFFARFFLCYASKQQPLSLFPRNHEDPT